MEIGGTTTGAGIDATANRVLGGGALVYCDCNLDWCVFVWFSDV